MTPEAVIFDVDGTLADTEEAHRQAFNATFREFGLHWHWDAERYVALTADAFEVIGAGEQAAAKKLAPDVYLWVLQELKLPGQDCLAVEDSSNGVRAALGAGIPVLAAVNRWTRGDDFTGASAVLDDLSAADLAALERWQAGDRQCPS